MVALARLALGGTLTPDDFQFALDSCDSVLHAASVRLQLGFAFTPAHADPAFLPGQVTPKTCEPREQMLELRQLDLELAFASAGPLGKDVEDQRGAVQNFAVKDFFKVSALGGSEFVVKDNRVDIRLAAMMREIIGLALADESARAGGSHFLESISHNFASR